MYVLPVSSVHRIRQSLQILLDYAERSHEDMIRHQVLLIEQEIASQRVNV